jgi:hypothetical protein
MRLSHLFCLLLVMLPCYGQTTLVSSAGHLDFQLTEPNDQSATQTITITSTGPDEVDFQIVRDWNYWVYIPESSTRTPGTIKIYVRRLTSPGIEAYPLTIVPAHGNRLVIPITLEYLPAAPQRSSCTPSAASITWTAPQGTNPAAVPISCVSASGAISDKNWLLVNGQFSSYRFRLEAQALRMCRANATACRPVIIEVRSTS